MKNKFFFFFISTLIMGMFISGCDEDEPDPPVDPDTVTDADGNVYPTVEIGSQTWMAENLRTTKYSDGSAIAFPGADNEAWQNSMDGAYAWYGNDEANKNNYGAVYNWYAVENSRGLCPTGWRVPTQADWQQMKNYLINEYDLNNDIQDVNALGNKLKSCRQIDSPLGGECNTTQHPRWHNHETQFGTDDFGFSGLPGGGRHNTGEFSNLGIYGFWWSADEYDDRNAIYYNLNFDQSILFNGNTPKEVGTSVRCIKN